MTSKNSFLVSMVENNKRRNWVWIVSMLFWFFYYPVAMAMIMSRKKGHNLIDKLTGEAAKSRLVGAAGDWLRADGAVILFVTLLAVVCAIQGFSYLYSRKKVDLYHSVPVSKTYRFAVIYVNGVLMFFVPYFLNLLFAVLVAGVNGGMSSANLRTAVISLFMNLILYLGTYGLTVIAVMMTGNIVITLFATAIFLLYELATRALFMEYKRGFFEYFSYNSSEITNVVTSPAWQHYNAVKAIYDYIGKVNLDFAAAAFPVVKCILLAAAFGFISYICYKRRPAEAAGKTMSFPKTKAVIKILLTVPFTLFAGLTVREIVGTGYEQGNCTVLVLFVMTAASIISCCIIEVIYELDIRASLRKKYQILITGACVAAIYCTFQFDLTGFDKWVPDPEKLEEADIIVSSAAYRQPYLDESLENVPAVRHYLKEPGITDIAAVCELSGKKMKRADIKEEDSVIWFEVAYRMKNGKTIWRDFAINAEEEDILSKILSNPEYKRACYQIYDDSIFNKLKEKDSFQIIYNAGMSVENLSPDDTDIIRQLYIKDLNNSDYTTLRDEFICGRLDFSVRTGSYGYIYFEYDIYPSYSNIIGYLKEKGLFEEMAMNPENIASVTVTNYHNELYKEGGGRRYG
ncbi:MAG: hypothetical protein GX235_08095 [Clostridiales bacterium]|nr:hypothetical protein [Clostridiales bacterium]